MIVLRNNSPLTRTRKLTSVQYQDLKALLEFHQFSDNVLFLDLGSYPESNCTELFLLRVLSVTVLQSLLPFRNPDTWEEY